MNSTNKFFQVTFIAMLFSFAVTQQLTAQSFARAGIKGGLNASNLYIDNVDDQNARLGFNVGVFGQILSSDVFALQLELLYSTKGSKAQYGSGFFNQEIKYNLNYLDLPVLAVIKVGEVVEFHAGGYASYLLNADISYSGLVNGVDKIDKDNLKSFDYGLSGGLGFNFGRTQVGARYNYGLVEIAESSSASSLLGSAKNSTAQVFLAFNLVSE